MVAALTQMLLSIPPLATSMLIVCNAATFYYFNQSSRTSTSTIPSTSPSSSSSSQEFSTTPEPARATSLPSTYASDTEEYPVALPMILLVVCVIGTLACGIALCAHNMWKAKTKQKQRRNGQQKETNHSSVQDVVD